MEITEKYSKPTRYDAGKYGEISRNGGEYFIQVSKDPESYCWLPLGDFLCRVFLESGSNMGDDFIKSSLDIYEKKNEEPRMI